MSRAINYNLAHERAQLEFDLSMAVRELFGVESTEELYSISEVAVRKGKSRVLNLASALGVPDQFIEAEEAVRHSIVLPSEDLETKERLKVQSIKIFEGEIVKIKPSYLLLKQVYKGFTNVYYDQFDILGCEDYDRIRSETIGYLNRTGIALRLINKMNSGLSGDNNMFRGPDKDKGKLSFSTYMAGRFAVADHTDKFSIDSILATQDNLSGAMGIATEAIRSSNPNRSNELDDCVTFGLIRPMKPLEAKQTVEVYNQKTKPVIVPSLQI